MLVAILQNLPMKHKMTKKILTLFLSFLTLTAFAQNRMRTIEELINKDEPGWTIVKEWIDKATNKVEVLTVDTIKANDALYKTQVTTRSPMGAVIYMTGGILIDNGWIRILGSGNAKLNRNLPEWNKGKSFEEYGQAPKYLLIADDAIGGFYMLNGGGLGTDLGKIYYYSPDNLEYEPLDMTYSEFLNFCFNNDLDKFYENSRWTNWKAEVEKLEGDKVYNFFPYLWTREGKDINKNSRKAIPIEEQFSLNMEFRKQLGLDK
jgi:hypothetical protein